MVQYALNRGHEVTIFNRGRTNTHLFPEVEKLVGDRNGDLTALEGRTWDVVIDNNATIPRWVRLTARLLREAAGQYIFVSSISVYAAEAKGYEYMDRPDLQRVRVNEASPVKALPEGFTGEAVTGDSYGPFKALAEEEARSAFPGHTTVVRPGLIAGPRDPTDRFTYWPARIRHGGEVLAPGE
jgi:2'-hydroxyisoflavone reductase